MIANSRTVSGALLVLSAALAGVTSAQVTDLTLSKSGDDVVMNWTTGAGPFRVIRSQDPVFMSGNKVVDEDLPGSPAIDPGALSDPKDYYYQVLGDGESSPGAFDLNPPRPEPTITALTPNVGQAGNTVVIEGTNFPQDGSGMVVLFASLPADATFVASTQVEATVPGGAGTGGVVVCVAGVCSNAMRFTVTVGPTFQSLSSLAFESGTGSLWLGDRASADSVIEIDSAGIVHNRASFAEPFISNVSPADGAGRVYFSNGTVSQFNQGTVRYIDSPDNSNNFFRAAGQGGTDPVWARGIAANDAEADVAYFLDGNQNTVRRVPLFGLIDKNWGNASLFSFNDPAGARFDSAGNLYVSSTTAIYRVAPDETVTIVASGFTGAAGLDLSEDTGIPTLLVADQATGDVFLVDGEDGGQELVAQGLTGAGAVTFSEDITTGELFYDVAEPTRIVRLPDPRIKFAVGKETPVLIHKYGNNDAYPSPFQTEDGKITIEATVSDGRTPTSGVTVYFRVVDPKDHAPYIGGSKNDNKGGPGVLSVTSAVSDASGRVETELTITEQFAGDNYRVEASFRAPPNFKRAATSGILIAWKRAYVEYDKMYKVGEFVSQNSGAGEPDPTIVYVFNPSTFFVGDEVHVLSASTPATVVGEVRSVTMIGSDHIVVNAALTNLYESAIGTPPNDQFPYSFVGRRDNGTYDAQPSAQVLARAFDDPFTEWQFLNEGRSFLPSWPVADFSSTYIDDRTFLYFQHLNRTTVHPFTNHVQLVAAADYEQTPPPAPTKGLTSAANSGPTIAKNWSWIFTRTIANECPGCTGQQVQQSIENVTAHELAHQWNVNPGGAGGHDMEDTWNDPTRRCLMNEARNGITGVVKFHANLAAPTPDLFCIREHVDDLNQDTCP